MSDSDQAVTNGLAELSIEQLLVDFRRLPRLPGGVNQREMQQLDAYIQEAHNRDAQLGATSAEINNLRAQIAALQAETERLNTAGRWQPAENGTYHTDCEYILVVEGSRLYIPTFYGGLPIDMPRDLRLCQLQPEQDKESEAS